MGKPLSLSGKRFGRLRVLGKSEKRASNGCVYWHCVCDCGSKREVIGRSLVAGMTVSCGCYHKEQMRGQFVKHGLSRHPLHNKWISMKQRCYNPNHIGYHNWGGRGIGVCDEWRDDFQAFYDWCVMNGWKKGLDIDRIDNDKDYSPENCRFITRRVNLNNTRKNRYIEFDGKRMTISQWGLYLGGKPNLIQNRLGRGWPLDRALTEKADQRRNTRGLG